MDDEIRNLIAVFGCPPNKTVPANSRVISDFFDQIKTNVNPYTRELLLPEALNHWTPEGDGEIVAKTVRSLRFTVPKKSGEERREGESDANLNFTNSNTSSLLVSESSVLLTRQTGKSPSFQY